MTTRTARNHRTTGPSHTSISSPPEQLSLLATSDLPVQFRLDRRTRERGLEHVAEIRRLLAAKHAGVEAMAAITTAPRTTLTATRHDQAA